MHSTQQVNTPVQSKPKWQLYTGAVLPKGNQVVGLGIVITRSDVVWFTASMSIQVEDLPAPVTSITGDYAAADEGLKKAIELLPASTTMLAHWTDNRAIAEDWQFFTREGLLPNNLQLLLKVRETRNRAAFQIQGGWLPRAQNAFADHHAKLGAQGVTDSAFPGRNVDDD